MKKDVADFTSSELPTKTKTLELYYYFDFESNGKSLYSKTVLSDVIINGYDKYSCQTIVYF